MFTTSRRRSILIRTAGRRFSFLLICALVIGFSHGNPNRVEVYHYWTTASESKAIGVLKNLVSAAGIDWIDATVEGAAGENAFTGLSDRVVKANAPDIGQIKGYDIQRWARLGMLNPLTEINIQRRWQSTLPDSFLNHLKFQDKLYAIPIHIHRTNWLWLHKPTLDAYNLSPPEDWEDLMNILSELDRHGVPLIAQSLDGWQLATLFEGLVLATHGPAFYKNVFVDLSFSHARSPEMAQVFNRLRQLQRYFIPKHHAGRWDENAISVADGQANLMFMGDWMKGELANRNRLVNRDYICVPTPGLHEGFIYDVNSFASFKSRQDNVSLAKDVLNLVLTSEFQTDFNRIKGSMPIHPFVDQGQFDQCTLTAIDAFQTATSSDALVPSIAHGLANINGVQHGLFEALEEFIRTPTMTSEVGAKLLAKRMRFGAYYITN